MKNMLKGTNGTHFSARLMRSTAVALTGVALGFALWTATATISLAQESSPQQMLEQSMPAGQTMASASKPQFLGAVCSAVKKFRNAAPQIIRAAVEARGAWRNDIIRTAVRCMGVKDCAGLGSVHSALVGAFPADASEITDLFAQLAPSCTFGGGEPAPDEGNYGNPPGNLNPPPGSVGGSGGQGNLVAVCHNGRVIFVSPRAVQAHLNHGDSLGSCQVTPTQNP
jgi:hypothetical protein